MNGWQKSPKKTAEDNHQPLIGNDIIRFPLPARSDLSDWLDLMETVEALCPKWPPRPAEKYGPFKL